MNINDCTTTDEILAEYNAKVFELQQCRDVLCELVRACGAGMNWMEQVSRAKLNSSTRGILTVDVAMCGKAIERANRIIKPVKP